MAVSVYKEAHDKLVEANEELDLANVVEEVSLVDVRVFAVAMSALS